MITAKTVALDSNHWANWIRDAFSPDRVVRQDARGFAEDLLALGYTILLSCHHVQELMAHADEQIVNHRLSFIRNMTLISWIGNFGEFSFLGGITDIMAAEVVSAFRYRGDAQTVREAAKPLLLRSGPGSAAIGDDPLLRRVMRDWAQQRADDDRTITAIAPFRFIRPETTVGELMAGKIRDPEQTRSIFTALQQALAIEITEHGDRRITDPAARAQSFIGEAEALAQDTPASARELIVWGLAKQGIEADDLHPEMTMAEVGRLGLFRSQLRVVAPNTGIPFEDLKGRVSMEQLPHRVIAHALEMNAPRLPERKGSNLNDGYLASLAAYADTLYVDKRTAENFRRATLKTPELRPLIGTVAKAASYREIPAQLKQQAPL